MDPDVDTLPAIVHAPCMLDLIVDCFGVWKESLAGARAVPSALTDTNLLVLLPELLPRQEPFVACACLHWKEVCAPRWDDSLTQRWNVCKVVQLRD